MITRLLPVAEWPRLVDEGVEPFASCGLPDNPDLWRIIVAELDGRIMAVSTLRNEVLNDWWIASDCQRNPRIFYGLWDETRKLLDAEGITRLHATISDAQPDVQDMAVRLGYIPSGGTLYLLHVPDAVLNRRG